MTTEQTIDKSTKRDRISGRYGHFIFLFKGDQKVVDKFHAYLRQFDVINISIITYYEILGGLKFKRAEKQINDLKSL